VTDTMQIAGRRIGNSLPVYVIAEVSLTITGITTRLSASSAPPKMREPTQ